MKTFLQNIKKKAKKKKKKIVFPEFQDDRILKAISKIVEKKIAVPVIVGDRDKIIKRLAKFKIKQDNVIIYPMNKESVLRFSKKLYSLRKKKGLSLAMAKKLVSDENYFATMLVYVGDCDGMVSGAMHSTHDTVLPALQIIKTKNKGIVSGAFFIIDKDVKIYSDCAINIEPDSKELASIAINSYDLAKRFGISPKLAMLSFSTNKSASHESVDSVRKAIKNIKSRRNDIFIESELQLDAALDENTRKKKFPESQLKGEANVLIFPDLNSGNIGYKLAQYFGAKAVGPILVGLKKPVNDLSRGCSVDDIVNLAVITALQAEIKT